MSPEEFPSRNSRHLPFPQRLQSPVVRFVDDRCLASGNRIHPTTTYSIRCQTAHSHRFQLLKTIRFKSRGLFSLTAPFKLNSNEKTIPPLQFFTLLFIQDQFNIYHLNDDEIHLYVNHCPRLLFSFP